MNVVPLTLTISLCLVFTFVVFFLREQARGRISSAERDSLLPLAEENPRLAHASVRRDSGSHGDDRRRSAAGEQAPCADCLRRG